MFEVVGSSVEFDDLRRRHAAGRPPLRPDALLARASSARSTWSARRSACSLLAPLLIAIAIAIKLDSPRAGALPPAARRPRRQRFEMLKFRTMVADADARKAELLRAQRGATGCSRSPTTRAITRVGRFLRKTVARRAAAAVQRPARRDEPRRPAPAGHRGGPARSRAGTAAGCDLTPGMTGPWQILGSRARPAAARWSRIDYLYVANWSLWTRRQDPAAHRPVRHGPARPVSVASRAPLDSQAGRAQDAQRGELR